MSTLPPNPGIYHDTTVCELVLEDNPVAQDSSLAFESFPTEIQEAYSTNWQEMGQERMPQPGFIAYRGGNWSSFTLQLIFRAGTVQGESRAARLQGQIRRHPLLLTDAQLQQLLIGMEEKVRWVQALAFPLERGIGDTAARQIRGGLRAGSNKKSNPFGATTENINGLRRNDPPIVLLVFGSWWVQRCYVENVTITWQAPFHPVTVRPYGATVDLTIRPIKAVYPTWQLIRQQAGTGGYDVDKPAEDSPLIRGIV